jgi:hypothetical protein
MVPPKWFSPLAIELKAQKCQSLIGGNTKAGRVSRTECPQSNGRSFGVTIMIVGMGLGQGMTGIISFSVLGKCTQAIWRYLVMAVCKSGLTRPTKVRMFEWEPVLDSPP